MDTGLVSMGIDPSFVLSGTYHRRNLNLSGLPLLLISIKLVSTVDSRRVRYNINVFILSVR